MDLATHLIFACCVPAVCQMLPAAAQVDEEEYRVIRVPKSVYGVNLADVDGLIRDGAGGLFDRLLPHQLNTVRGMFYHAAIQETRGCILADQTGLGKLVQAVAVAAAIETYLYMGGKSGKGADKYNGVLFVFPVSIYNAQVKEMNE